MKKTMKNLKLKQATLKNNLKEIYHNINREKPQTKKISLLAVTKKQSAETVNDAINLGLTLFGENKVQEAEKKFSNISTKIELHLIGHLQKNKIKKAIQIFNVIQTVDSLELAIKINEQAKKINQHQRIYCQINIGKDPQKFGFKEPRVLEKIFKITKLPNLHLEGLMTILPFNLNNLENQKLYVKMFNLYKKINEQHPRCKELSMGMSGDYISAIRCGATMIRIGSKIFGERE